MGEKLGIVLEASSESPAGMPQHQVIVTGGRASANLIGLHIQSIHLHAKLCLCLEKIKFHLRCKDSSSLSESSLGEIKIIPSLGMDALCIYAVCFQYRVMSHHARRVHLRGASCLAVVVIISQKQKPKALESRSIKSQQKRAAKKSTTCHHKYA